MAILKVLSTDTVEQAFINKYNPTVDEIIVSIDRATNIITYTKEGGGNVQAILLQAPDSKINGLGLTLGSDNLKFDVSAGTYTISDEQYSYAGGSDVIILGAGDPANDRVDLVVLDDNELLIVIPGTPSAAPLVAPLVAANQIFIASFIVKAGATTGSSNDVFINTTPPTPTDGAYLPSAQLGQIIEDAGHIEELGGLLDVTLTAPADDELLKFSGGKWVNALAALSELSDVNTAGLADNYIIKYDNGSGEWIMKLHDLNNLTDVAVSGEVVGDVLKFNGAEWVNLPGGEIVGPLILNDVISPPSISSVEDDYNPAGLNVAQVLRLSTNNPANRDITGIAAQADGTKLHLFNVGNGSITLISNSVSSSANNRFIISLDFIIEPDEGVCIWYDGTDNRWRLIRG